MAGATGVRGSPVLLVGVDGCRGGWVAVLDRGDGATEVVVVRSFADVVALGADLVGVDMPIGLTDVGPRACDVEARARLGPRRASVFPAPARAVLHATDHADAVRRSQAATGRGISVQAWNLVPKVAEVDAVVNAGDPVIEVHPELSFAMLSGAPLSRPKRHPEGRSSRLALLTADFPDVAHRLAGKPPGCAADDVLDAYAVLWSTRRAHDHLAVTLGDGTRDERGRSLAITA